MDQPVRKLQVCKSVLSVFAPYIWQKQIHIKCQCKSFHISTFQIVEEMVSAAQSVFIK